MLKKCIPLVTFLCSAAPIAAYARDSGHVACAGQVKTANEERIGMVVLVEDWRGKRPDGEFGRDYVLTAVYEGQLYKGKWLFANGKHVGNRRDITLSNGKQVLFVGTFQLKNDNPGQHDVELKGKLFRPLGKNETADAGATGRDQGEVVEGTLSCVDFST